MIGEWRQVTAPAAEPLTIDEAKLHLRVDGTAENTLITSLITTARMMCEEQTWRALITQTWDLCLPRWTHRAIVLPRPALQSVTYIKYTDAAGVEHTLDTSCLVIDTNSTPARLTLKRDYDWPTDELQEGMPIVVRFVAGYGAAAANVPEPLKQGMRLVLGHLYANREAVNVGNIVNELPLAVRWLWQPYEVRW